MALLDRLFKERELHDPRPIRAVFSNTVLAPLWLVARVYLGYQWILAGAHKAWGDERWINRAGPDGLALKGFWDKATATSDDAHDGNGLKARKPTTAATYARGRTTARKRRRSMRGSGAGIGVVGPVSSWCMDPYRSDVGVSVVALCDGVAT